jgi:hypothetical protein
MLQLHPCFHGGIHACIGYCLTTTQTVLCGVDHPSVVARLVAYESSRYHRGITALCKWLGLATLHLA